MSIQSLELDNAPERKSKSLQSEKKIFYESYLLLWVGARTFFERSLCARANVMQDQDQETIRRKRKCRLKQDALPR